MKNHKLKLDQARIRYDADPKQLYRLFFKNFFLSVLTLGFYRFWGKTQIRQYLASCHHIDGERFVYTGSGEELFFGFFKALVYLVPMLACMVMYYLTQAGIFKVGYLAYTMWLVYFFIYGSMQYRVSRTRWRGIFSQLSGNRRTFAFKQIINNTVLKVLSLGLISPYIAIERQEYIMQHFQFGTLKGEFDSTPHKLVSQHLIGLLLAIVSLGYSTCWYRAKLYDYIYAASHIGEIRLGYTATARAIWKFHSINALLFFTTLGLAYPYIIHRSMKFQAEHITFTGEINLDELEQISVEGKAKFDDGAAIFGSDVGFAFG